MADQDLQEHTHSDPENDAEAAAVPAATEDEETPFEFAEDPVFDVQYKGDCAYEVKTTIPPANTRKQSEEMFDELKHEAEVPGFRRGRAPRKLIERKFGKAVKSEVDTKLIGAAFQRLVKDQDLHPMDVPVIDGLEELNQRGEADPLVVTFRFEVLPRVGLGKYRGLEVERPVCPVDDEQVEKVLEGLRLRHAVYEPVADSVAEDGDRVDITFRGLVDGEPFPGGSASNYPYILGSGRFFKEFDEALKGAAKGAEVTCEVTLGDDLPREELRNKTAQFTITVEEIRRRVLPELNDEFAHQLGFENVAALREKHRADLESELAEQAKAVVERRAIDAVLRDSTFEIPRSLIDSVARDYYEDDIRRLLAMRIPKSEVDKRESELRQAAADNALLTIKRTVSLNEIAEAEGVEATEEDFEREAETISRSTGIDTDVVSRYIGQEEHRNRYLSRILRAKAAALVVDSATIVDRVVTHDEFVAACRE